VKLHLEAAPGELAAKLPDLLKTLERMAGHPSGCACDLHKAVKAVDTGEHAEKDLEPLIPVLKHLLDSGRQRRDEIQATMQRKLLAVLEEVEAA